MSLRCGDVTRAAFTRSDPADARVLMIDTSHCYTEE